MVSIKKLDPVKRATASMMPRPAASIIAFDTEGRNILFSCSAGNKTKRTEAKGKMICSD